MSVRKGIFLFLCIWMIGCVGGEKIQVQARGTEGKNDSIKAMEENENIDVSMLDEVDFTELDKVLAEQGITEEFEFRELTERVINGEEIDKKWLFDSMKNVFLGEVNQSRGYMVQIILLITAFALLYNFSNVFQNAAVTDISFYIVYMILLALLMKSFSLMGGIIHEALRVMLDFMTALVPAFSLTIVLSTGSVTALGFHQLTLLVLYIIENVLMHVVVPAVHIYIILELLNHLTREEMISKMADLLKLAVEWILKFLFTLVIGINVVQGLLGPVIDAFKSGTFSKAASLIPGIGNSIKGATEILIGSGIIIKNGVGVAGIIIILVLCLAPMLKVGIMMLLYKVSAAVIQPIADKRLIGCVSGMGEGARLLGKVLIMANVMLLLTFALVIAATTWNR